MIPPNLLDPKAPPPHLTGVKGDRGEPGRPGRPGVAGRRVSCYRMAANLNHHDGCLIKLWSHDVVGLL